MPTVDLLQSGIWWLTWLMLMYLGATHRTRYSLNTVPHAVRVAPPWHRAYRQRSQRQLTPVSHELGLESESNPSVVLSLWQLLHDCRTIISISTEGPIQYWHMLFVALHIGYIKRGGVL